jgi:hypothetical protein
MNRQTSGLLLKSNRVLGSRLVEHGLVSIEEMDQANELFIQRARAKELKRASLLRILLYENQTLMEERLLDYQLEHHPVGAILLENYRFDYDLILRHPLEWQMASWTIPLDYQYGRWFVATAYYLSDIVREFWEEHLDGRITWFICPMSQFESSFEELLPLAEAKLESATQED